MAKGVPILGKDPLGKAKYANVTESGDLRVQLSGTIKDVSANRPAANSVDVGTVYWSVDTGDVSVSTGTEWRSLGVA